MTNYKIYVNGMYAGVGLFTTEEVKTVEKDFEIKLVPVSR